jgi:hypothetical protein
MASKSRFWMAEIRNEEQVINDLKTYEKTKQAIQWR